MGQELVEPLCQPGVATFGGDRADPGWAARTRWSTGVEMEALVAASACCLTLYDMAKALDRGIEIVGPRLLLKEGGRSGRYRRPRA